MYKKIKLCKKDNYYHARILWRAKKHNLFYKSSCKQFSDLPQNYAILIKKTILQDINPVIVFWNNEQCWTVLGTKAICSFYEQKLICCDLDEINKQVSIYQRPNMPLQAAKFNANLILLKEPNKLIWAPAGTELFALMNILLMFPLKN